MMRCLSVMLITFFFFQAEDGIRDVAVTGVQTCALPIFFPSLVAVIVAEPAPAPLTRPLPSTVTAELLLAQVTVRPVSALPRESVVVACSCVVARSEEHTSELQSRLHLVCRLLLEKKKKKN